MKAEEGGFAAAEKPAGLGEMVPVPSARWGSYGVRYGSLVLAFVVSVACVSLFVPGAYVFDVDLGLIAGIGAIGANVVTGYAGQISIGTAGFLGIGGYSVVILRNTLPFPLPILVGMGISAVVGFIVGLPSLRLRGMYLIFSTIAFYYVAYIAFQEYDSITGASAGHDISPPNFLTSYRVWLVVLAVILAFVAIAVWAIVRGTLGRQWSALRTNEVAAAVMGVNVTRAKLQSFAASSVIIALAGGLEPYIVGNVTYTYYTLNLAISYLSMILIGGLASIAGSIIGAGLVTVFPFALQAIGNAVEGGSTNGYIAHNLSSIDVIVYGIAVVMILEMAPHGVIGIIVNAMRRVRRWAR